MNWGAVWNMIFAGFGKYVVVDFRPQYVLKYAQRMIACCNHASADFDKLSFFVHSYAMWKYHGDDHICTTNMYLCVS